MDNIFNLITSDTKVRKSNENWKYNFLETYIFNLLINKNFKTNVRFTNDTN